MLGTASRRQGDPRPAHCQKPPRLWAACLVLESLGTWLCEVEAGLAQIREAGRVTLAGILVSFGVPAEETLGAGAAPCGPLCHCPRHPSTIDTAAISVPGCPTRDSQAQEASGDPHGRQSKDWGRQPAGLARGGGGWGKPGLQTTVSKEAWLPQAHPRPRSGGGVAPALAGPGVWWAAPPRDWVVCQPERVLPWEPGVQGPSGPAPWAGCQGRSPEH